MRFTPPFFFLRAEISNPLITFISMGSIRNKATNRKRTKKSASWLRELKKTTTAMVAKQKDYRAVQWLRNHPWSSPCSAKPPHEMTKFCVVWERYTTQLIFQISIWNITMCFTFRFRDRPPFHCAVRDITLSRRNHFQKAPFQKCFTSKRKRFQIPPG